MRGFKKDKEAVNITANGVPEDKFVVQFGVKQPNIYLYEKQERNGVVTHKRVNRFYKMKRAVQCAWAISNKGE